jgi:hypothetical protein
MPLQLLVVFEILSRLENLQLKVHYNFCLYILVFGFGFCFCLHSSHHVYALSTFQMLLQSWFVSFQQSPSFNYNFQQN